MQISMGIVGLPNVGKSTLFNALTKKSVPAENYPFCTIDPSVGVVAVPDNRLVALAKMSHSEKTIPAAIEFVDIAGLVEGASKGEGLGNKFLANIREVDALVHMVRLFSLETSTGNIINHVYGSVDPLRDVQVIMMELILADIASLEGRKERIARDVKRGDKDAVAEHALIERMLPHLGDKHPAFTCERTEDERAISKSWHLLTDKPILYALNKSSTTTNYDETHPNEYQAFLDHITADGAQHVVLDADMEHDVKDLSQEERAEFLEELGEHADGIDVLIARSYHLLGLISFFTTGPAETRAWTIEKGYTARDAGGAIHGDFRDKFIRAETIQWDELLKYGSWSAGKDAGTIRAEGKQYIVQDGDVMVFHHS